MNQRVIWDSHLYQENFSGFSPIEQIELWTSLAQTISATREMLPSAPRSERSEAAHQLVSALGCLGLTEASLFFKTIEHQNSDEFHPSIALSVLNQLALFVDDQIIRIASK